MGRFKSLKINQNEQSGNWLLETKNVMEKAQGDGLSFKEAKVVNRGDY